MIPPRLVDTTLETVSNDMLFEVLLKHDCIDKDPVGGRVTLCLTTKGAKGFTRLVLVWMKTAVGLATGLDRVRTEGAHSYGLPGEVLTARGET
jgi:hypothetical protein